MRSLIDTVYDDQEMREALFDITQFKISMISKTFLLNHPECMSGELETLMDKIMYFTTKEGKKLKDQKKKRLQRIKQLAEKNIKRVKKSTPKKKPKAPIEEEEEEESESESK